MSGLKLKVLPRFPSRLIGRAGIDVSKVNGDYFLDLDYSDFTVLSGPPVGTTVYGLAYNLATKQYVLIPFGSGGGGGALVPPTPTTLGGIFSYAAQPHKFLTQVGVDGSIIAAQPVAADITGLAASATTDTTNAANISSGILAEPRMPLFLQSGSGAVAYSFTNKLRQMFSVRDFGAVGDNVTDDTAAVQAAITAGNAVIPPGLYKLTGDIQIPSNRHIWVQKGAVITNTGGRFTGYVPGGGAINFQIDGTINFKTTATGTDLPGWAANAGVATRGVIELGGTTGAIAYNIRVFGRGVISADYPWPGSPPSGYSDINYQLNRKGVCLVNINSCSCEGLDVSGIWGEAVYHQGPAGSYDCKFINNHVHEVAFNGLNFNSFGAQGFLMTGNYVQNAWQGIEMSTGSAFYNHIIGTTNGILSGAGGGGGPIHIVGNSIVTATRGIDIEFSPSVVEQIMIEGNVIANMQAGAIILDKISAFLIKNNLTYQHALGLSAAGILIGAGCSYGYVDGNVIRAPGSHSTGTVVNNAGAAVTIGTNPVF